MPWNFVISGITTSIAVPTTVFFLSRESWKRKYGNLLFPSKGQAIFSYLSLCVGPLYATMSALFLFEGIRPEVLAMCMIFLQTQSLFMEYYQLSRLYYCFSRDQIHSDKGYPKWLFKVISVCTFHCRKFHENLMKSLYHQVMVTAATVSVVFGYPFFVISLSRIGTGKEGLGNISETFHFLPLKVTVMTAGICFVTLIFCDIFTALLYWNKIRSDHEDKQRSNTPICGAKMNGIDGIFVQCT